MDEKIVQLELALMQSRDFAIGAAAEAGEAIANLNKYLYLKDELKDARIHIENHLIHIARLEEALGANSRLNEANRVKARQLELVYKSATWKIGRFIMLPIRILRKLVG